MQPSATLVLLVHATIALAVIAAATVLLALHDIDSPTAIATIGIGVTLIGGNAAALSVATGATQGTARVPADHLEQLTASAVTPAPGTVTVTSPAPTEISVPRT